MTERLIAGFIGDQRVLERLIKPLAGRGLDIETRELNLDRDIRNPLDVILIDAAHTNSSPQLISQKLERSHLAPFLVLVPHYDFEEATVWSSLGAMDYQEFRDIDRLAVHLTTLAVTRHRNLPSDLLQTVIDAVPVPIFFKDENGQYLGANRAFEKVLGIAPEDIIGKTVFDIAPKNLAVVYSEADRKLIDAGGTQVYEAQVKFADGSLHDVIFHKAVFYKHDGSKGGQVGAMLDITERKKLEAKFERWATIDPLTAVYNRRSYFRLSDVELSRCRREERPLSVLVIDIDHFKDVNDTHGHAAGDEVLVHLASAALEIMRKHDIFARAGGEEFYVTLGNTDLPRAERIAERLRRKINKMQVEFDGEPIGISISIGVTECALAQESFEDALKRADFAMYEAKRLGRNRVICQSLQAAS